jgi:lysophospholipase L1-like esterase
MAIAMAGVWTAQAAAPGLVARWTFDDAATDKTAHVAKDSVGTYDGTLQNGAVFTAGQSGGGVAFDGKEAMVSGAAMPALGQAFTIACWVKIDDLAAGQHSVFCGNTKGSHYLRINPDGSVWLLRSETAMVAISTGKIAAQAWQHVAVTYDHGAYAFYINAAAAGSGSVAHVAFVPSVNFTMGRECVDGAYMRPMTGALDELCLYTRALPADEIAAGVTALPKPAPVVRQGAGDLFIPADDARLAYSDYARLTFVAVPTDPGQKMARFDRITDVPGKGYQWDNPGARLRVRTDAAKVQVALYYNEKHVSTSARNPAGAYFIDGGSVAAGTFSTVQRQTVRAPETLAVQIAAPAPGMHDYELVLPYGDSVDVLGISVAPGARFDTPPPRTAQRLAAYGDSITHGFTASDVSKTYAFLFAQKKNWQLVNMGLGGRSSAANDGALIAALGCDVVSVLIGANDWQGGRPLAAFRANMEGFIRNLRAKQPAVPLIVITPLWVPPTWKPPAARLDLEAYRQVLREVVAAAHDPRITLVEGPALIDHELRYLDAVVVHPNNAGFAQMAERLAAAVR